jgi:hypothetical protein
VILDGEVADEVTDSVDGGEQKLDGTALLLDGEVDLTEEVAVHVADRSGLCGVGVGRHNLECKRRRGLRQLQCHSPPPSSDQQVAGSVPVGWFGSEEDVEEGSVVVVGPLTVGVPGVVVGATVIGDDPGTEVVGETVEVVVVVLDVVVGRVPGTDEVVVVVSSTTVVVVELGNVDVLAGLVVLVVLDVSGTVDVVDVDSRLVVVVSASVVVGGMVVLEVGTVVLDEVVVVVVDVVVDVLVVDGSVDVVVVESGRVVEVPGSDEVVVDVGGSVEVVVVDSHVVVVSGSVVVVVGQTVVVVSTGGQKSTCDNFLMAMI